MIEWIWFFSLTVLSWVFAYRVWHEVGSDAGQDQLLSHGAMLIAILIFSDATGFDCYSWVQSLLPQTGTDINGVTALLITALFYIFWIVHPVFAGWIFMDSSGNIALKNFKQKLAWCKTDNAS